LLTRLKEPQAPLNLLRVQAVERVGDHWQGRVGTETIVLPAAAADAKQDAHGLAVQFLPRDVMLGHTPLVGISARNQLHGHVREVVSLADRAYVAIDVGQFLWAELTLAAVAEMALAPGCPVICYLKTSALTVVG